MKIQLYFKLIRKLLKEQHFLVGEYFKILANDILFPSLDVVFLSEYLNVWGSFMSFYSLNEGFCLHLSYSFNSEKNF